MLSGFIIVYAHHKDINQPKQVMNYLKRRFIRLFPVYWLYTGIFCSLVAIGIGSASLYPATVGEWVSTIFLIRLNSFELPITPAWTLIHEMAFYLIFALLVLNRIFGVIVFSIWMVLGAIVFQLPDEGSRDALTTYFSPLNFNFLIGIGAFYLLKVSQSTALKLAFPIGLLLLGLIYYIENNWLSYEFVQIAYALSFGLIIVGAVAFERDGFKAGRFKTLSLIGDASYTIYLTHLAFLGLFAKIAFKLSNYVMLNNGALFFVVFVLTVVSGCLGYVFVERPLLRFCRRRMTSIKVAEPALVKQG